MPQANDRTMLEKLNHEYVKSVQNKDVAWFDANLSADFMNTASDGSLADRKTFLGQIAKGTGVSKIAEEEVVIRITGDTAIIHAATAFTTDAGTSGRGRYTDIWQKQNGRWICVAAHVSRRASA
ncbi:MAG: nuclear transport factor 2 family protein [Xanthobacteraceae bacterium]|nr:nuclear transport factor 2 family protein [Xanthobacteraceae bacterium]